MLNKSNIDPEEAIGDRLGFVKTFQHLHQLFIFKGGAKGVGGGGGEGGSKIRRIHRNLSTLLNVAYVFHYHLRISTTPPWRRPYLALPNHLSALQRGAQRRRSFVLNQQYQHSLGGRGIFCNYLTTFHIPLPMFFLTIRFCVFPPYHCSHFADLLP